MQTQIRARSSAAPAASTLPELLKEWRGQRSVYRAAHDLDIPVATYQGWEDGTTPRRIYLRKLAADLGVSFEHLADLTAGRAA